MYGFFILCLFVLFFNLDELVLDLVYLFRGGKRRERIPIDKLYHHKPRQIAVFVPAYKESDVIGDMLRTTLRLVNYPLSRYHIFVGLYPNDRETQAAVAAVAKQFPNVHPVIGPDPGPTTKAANLNHMWNYLQRLEDESGARFELVVLHDAEDLIHPLSLKLYNYLAEKVDMVQIPVLPVLPEASFRNFFRTLTTSTYADEFAESHLRRMVVRESIGKFVPSAGVGTALSRRAMNLLAEEGDGRPFDERALTEDYTMALHLVQKGLTTRFFLEGVERIDGDGRKQVEYVATREVFPNNFWAAVAQKTRWMFGIAFQTKQLRPDYAREADIGQRFLLFHDRKGKYSNLLAPFVFSAPVWLSFIYGGMDVSAPWFENLTFALLIGNIVLFIERQIVRGLAVNQYYGRKHALFAVLMPPLIPLRFVWGGVINFLATWRAWQMHLFGRAGGRPRWAKTEHTWYMPASLVQSTERRLGDLLLERRYVTVEQLSAALAQQRRSRQEPGQDGGHVGEILVRDGHLSPDQLRDALATLNKTWFLDGPVANWDATLRHAIPSAVARRLNAAPLLAFEDELVVVTTEPLDGAATVALQRAPNDTIRQIFASPLTVAAGLKAVYEGPLPDEPIGPRLGSRLVEAGEITVAELVDALQEQVHSGQRLGTILIRLGYITARQLEHYTDDAIVVDQANAGPAGADSVEPRRKEPAGKSA